MNTLHLGIQPEHILLEKLGYFRLSGWKTALYAHKNEQPHEYFNIYDYTSYTAPEILMREKPDMSSDYYSVGLILY